MSFVKRGEFVVSSDTAENEDNNKENVVVDLCFYLSENLEKIDESQMTIHGILNKFRATESLFIKKGIFKK